MLSIMRKNAKSWIIKTILFSIVLVFVFWGVGNFKSETSHKVATVNGEDIPFREYSRLYHDLMQEYGKSSSNLDLFTKNVQDNLKGFVLKQVIDHKIILQQAIAAGLHVTDKELVNDIQKNQSFFHNGIFDILQYEYVVSSLGFTPHQFEEYSRDILLIKKFISIIYGMVNISELEIAEWYEWYYSLINLSYVLFDPNNYNIVAYDKEEIYRYFEQHKQDYKTKCMYKLRYLTFNPDNNIDDVNVEDSEIMEYYNANLSNFTNEKKVNVSHILIRVDPDFKSDQHKKEHIENLSKIIKEGADFGELANVHSECPSKHQDGLIGDITYDSVTKPFADKAFSMVSGEISSPIRTRFGWHIIKVNNISEPSELSLSESKEQIKKIIIKSRSDMAAYNKAVSFLEKCYGEDALVNNAGLCNINLIETDWFYNESQVEFSENDFSIIMPIISSMQVGEISDICKLDNYYLIMQVMEKNNPEIPNFNDIKIKVTADFKAYKQRFKANSDAESFLTTVRDGISFENAIKIYKVTPTCTGFFTRNDLLNYKKFKNVLFEKSLEMFKIGDLTTKPVATDEGFYVAYMMEKKTPDPISSLSRSEKKHIINAITKTKQSKLLLEILTELRKTSKVKIDSSLQAD